MLTKANILIFSCLLSLYTFDTHAMLTRLRTLNRTKKTSCRNYSTPRESIDLKKKAAQQFKLKDPLSISMMYTLLQHNQQKLADLRTGAGFSLVGLFLGTFPVGTDICISLINQSPLLFSQPTIAASAILTALSLISFPKFALPYETREDIVKKLGHAFQTGQITHAEIHAIQTRTQEDIFNKLQKLNIVATKDISHVGKKGEIVQHVWDINNDKILNNTLKGDYNSSDYVLYLQDKK